MVVFSKLDPELPIASQIEAVKQWCERHMVSMHHMKKTCPNPHSGEKYYGFPPSGLILDVVRKAMLWTTDDEYDTMKNFSSAHIEIPVKSLLFTRDVFQEFRGAVAAHNYGV
jgi:hypothetical protein